MNRHRRVTLASTNPEERLDVALAPGVNKVGRLPEGNTLVLDSPAVSRFHAQITVSARGIFVRDLGSANGTFHNGQRVSSARLGAGDLVGFSDVFTFRLSVEGEAPERAPMMETEAAPTFPWERTGPMYGGGLVEHMTPPDAGGPEAATNPPRGIPHETTAPPKAAAGLQTLEGDGFQLSAILELSERAETVENLEQLEQLLVQVLDALISRLERGFLTYQQPAGDWKLLVLARPHAWDRREVRLLLQRAMEDKTVRVRDSRRDPGLGAPLTPDGDARALFPLRYSGAVRGAMFLVAPLPAGIDDRTLRLLNHFSETAASALDRLVGAA